MLPLDFRHRQQAVNEIGTPALARITRSGFVLDNVSTLQPARTVHRHKPAADVTKHAQCSSDDRGAQLAYLSWSSTKTLEHLTYELAMIPLFFLYLFYSSSIVAIAE